MRIFSIIRRSLVLTVFLFTAAWGQDLQVPEPELNLSSTGSRCGVSAPHIQMATAAYSTADSDAAQGKTADNRPAARGRRKPGGPNRDKPEYTVTWYPSSAVSGQNDDMEMIRQKLNVGAPVWKGDGDMVTVNAGIRHCRFHTDVVLPDSGRAFPDELWDLGIGVNYLHRSSKNWKSSLKLDLDSASDKPF